MSSNHLYNLQYYLTLQVSNGDNDLVMRRIKTKQLSRFMTSLIKAQNDVLSKLSSLLNKIHSSEMTLDVKEISTSTKVHGIVISKVIIEGVMVFTEYCVETLSYTKIVRNFVQQHCTINYNHNTNITIISQNLSTLT